MQQHLDQLDVFYHYYIAARLDEDTTNYMLVTLPNTPVSVCNFASYNLMSDVDSQKETLSVSTLISSKEIKKHSKLMNVNVLDDNSASQKTQKRLEDIQIIMMKIFYLMMIKHLRKLKTS